MYGPGGVRVEERDEPRIVEPTDAVIHISAACVLCPRNRKTRSGSGLRRSG
jgi:hypothetical protein